MLFVLVGLEDDGSKSGSSTDRLWGAEETVTSIKAFFEEFADVGLAAGERAGS